MTQYIESTNGSGATKAIPRRRLLSILALGGGAAVAWRLGVLPGSRFRTVTRRRSLMGTVVNVTVVGDDPEEAEGAVEDTLARMADLESRLSRYRDDSDVGRLNRTGAIDDACDALLDLIRFGHRMSVQGEGAFDLSISPVVNLYQRTLREEGGLPGRAAIEEARSFVDYRAIRVDGRRVSFARPGMGITVDGIGKGYIVDKGVETLRASGYPNVLVEAGGDLVASGRKSDDLAWTIGIMKPRPGMRLLSFETTDRAVATSGDYMQPFSADCTQHHILDPRTGYSSPELASSTVVAPNAATADGLATLTMVLGAANGRALIETLPDCEACFIAKDLAVTMTSGFAVS